MTVMIGMLRGVNVGGHNLIAMETLRALCASLDLLDAQTYVQSGNVVFRSSERKEAVIGKRLEDAIQRKLGFRPSVMLRTVAEMKKVVAQNPFAGRANIEPGKLLVAFLSAALTAEARAEVLKIKAGPEEVHCEGRELYIYFPDGQGRSKLPAMLDKVLKKSGTGRNWNTVLKLLQIAEKLETEG